MLRLINNPPRLQLILFFLNSQTKRNISKNEEAEEPLSVKTKKIPLRNSEINLSSLTDTQFKKEVIKVLKELR